MGLKTSAKIAMLVIAGIGVATGGTVLLNGGMENISLPGTGPKGPEVIDFTDQTKKDVQAWAQENEVGDESLQFEYAFDEEKAKDTVLSQSIPAGEFLEAGELLTVTLSDGPDPDKELELPDFTGKKLEEIQKWFTDNLFKNVTFATEETDEIEEGVFVSMEPASAKAKRSDKITVKTAVPVPEPEGIEVPELSRLSLAEIEDWGWQNGIYIYYEYQVNDIVPTGTFIGYWPAAGTILQPGEGVTVYLADASANAAPVENTEPQEQYIPEPEPEPQPEPEPEPQPEPEPEPEPEPAAVCPAGFPSSIFQTSDQVYSYIAGSYPACPVSVTVLGDSASNPNNYQGVADFELTDTYLNVTMYQRW